MVAVASLLPDNPEDEASVLAVLREHPELRSFIQQASTKALELFPGVRIQLDTVRWEAEDPPVRIVLSIQQPWDESSRAMNTFVAWLSARPDFDPDTVGLLPLWQESDARS